ncbi:MAG: diacylglycerol kinase [Candidatus Kerfeldbacteria bacterium]|nr:diacylglycerol kinase [Candidatus Kerfeldbacteria bacterium]
MTFLDIRKLGRSFRHALGGLVSVFRSQQNFRLQVVGAIAVFVLIAVLPVTAMEAALLILVVASVLVIELVNTIAESLIDLLNPRLSHHAGVVKDRMAAASLLASIAAFLVGLIIFLPYLVGTKP